MSPDIPNDMIEKVDKCHVLLTKFVAFWSCQLLPDSSDSSLSVHSLPDMFSTLYLYKLQPYCMFYVFVYILSLCCLQTLMMFHDNMHS